MTPAVIPGFAPRMMAKWRLDDDDPDPSFSGNGIFVTMPELPDLFYDEGVAWVCTCGQYNSLMFASCLARDCSVSLLDPLVKIVNKWHVRLALGTEN